MKARSALIPALRALAFWGVIVMGVASGCTADSGGGAEPAGSGGISTGGGGASAGTSGGAGGSPSGGGGAGATGGPTGTGGAAGGTTSFPPADPGRTGPFTTTTQTNVSMNPDPMLDFTLFRPTQLTGRHPVITWGNGTGASPQSYSRLLTLYASHGFIVIASNNPNVGMVTPPPMLEAVTWVLAEDMNAGSALYQHVDRAHIGATGHSQGAFAATTAGSDARIVTIAPIEGARSNRTLHGPALLLCGSLDTTVPCSGIMTAYDAITNVPVMYAEQRAADHTNWIFTAGGGQNPYFTITTAWFRVQLMGDAASRPMFYGTCSLCQDSATWVTVRKMLE